MAITCSHGKRHNEHVCLDADGSIISCNISLSIIAQFYTENRLAKTSKKAICACRTIARNIFNFIFGAIGLP